MSTVLDNPGARDYFTLDGKRSPGVSRIDSGGEFKVEIVDQRQPLTTGSASVVRGVMNTVTTYTLVLWTPEDLAAWNRMEAQLLEGARRTPKPRVWAFIDLRYSWVGQIILEELPAEKVDKPGGPWLRGGLKLHQYGRVKPVGGPLLPPDVNDAKLDIARQAATDAKARLAGAIAISRSGK